MVLAPLDWNYIVAYLPKSAAQDPYTKLLRPEMNIPKKNIDMKNPALDMVVL